MAKVRCLSQLIVLSTWLKAHHRGGTVNSSTPFTPTIIIRCVINTGSTVMQSDAVCFAALNAY